MKTTTHFITTRNILLINPPVARPCEAPAGLAALAGALRSRGVSCVLWDANLEGLLDLVYQLPPVSVAGPDAIGQLALPGRAESWTRRALNQRDANLEYLRGKGAQPLGHKLQPQPQSRHISVEYGSLGRYIAAVKDLDHLLTVASAQAGVTVSLANYQDPALQPVRSGDLLNAAEHPETNIFYPFFTKKLHQLMQGHGGQPEHSVVGFSINYLTQALCAFAMIGFVRRHYPSVQVVVGGGLITSWCSRPGWRNPFGGLLDDAHIVAGPGEEKLLAICGVTGDEGVFNSGGAGPAGESVGVDTGVVAEAGAGVMVRSQPVASRLFPEFSFESLPMEQYLSPGIVLPIPASLGCWWRKCAFCPEKAEGNQYRTMQPAQLLEMLSAQIDRWKPSMVHLLDNAVSPRLMESMIATPPAAPWFGFARFTPHLEDPAFCRDLASSGCVMLQLGLESGDQGVLEQMGKGISLTSASRTLRNLKEAGILTYVYLLFGTPWENLEKAKRTMEFAAVHAPFINYLNLAVFNLPAWGSDAEELETVDFYEGDLTLYRSFKHPEGWGRGQVRHFLDREFKRHPALGAIIRRDPPVFTSNHAPFFPFP